MKSEELNFLFSMGQAFTRAEAFLDLLTCPNILQDSQRYNKLLLRWHWSSTKSVARFIDQLEKKGIIVRNGLIYKLDLPIQDISESKLYKEPIEIIPLDENVYRGFKHLKLMKAQYETLIALGYTKAIIDETLDDIENFSGNSKYVDLFITTKKWLKKNFPDINQGSLFPERELPFKSVSPIKSKK